MGLTKGHSEPSDKWLMDEVTRRVKRKHRGSAKGKRHLTIEEREEYNKIVRKKNPLRSLKKFTAWKTP